MTRAHRRRPSGPVAWLIVVALLFAACGQTVEPTTTVVPSLTQAPPSTAPIVVPFAKAAYPPDGDAPCGQAKAPDASHAAYAGNFRRISATDATTVVFELCRPDVAFLSKIASPAFSINDSGWLRLRIDPAGTGTQAIVGEVNGTGPYRLEGWNRGSDVSLARNDAYWGAKALNERAIVRWGPDAAKRVDELAEATVDGVDELSAAGVARVSGDVSLALAPRSGLNVFYVGLNNTFAPFDNEKVRRAIAMGIDRAGIVANFFPPGSEVATHYTPCAIPHGCTGAAWYEYDPIQAKELLHEAGFPDGLDTTIHYQASPTPYLPDPAGVANELKTELLANLGIRAELVVEPEDTFIADADAGKLDGIHLLGQSGAFPDPTAFLDPRFGPGASAEFGKKLADVGKALGTAAATANGGKRDDAYAKANDLIRTHVPMIPVGRTASAAAFRNDVVGAGASPLRLERFASLTPGDRRQFVWLTTAEPPGLYCADEVDAISHLVCAQLMDGLYAYGANGAAPVPALAKRCDPNPELTVWTCSLRTGVVFHDGAAFDAGDVVLSFAVQWDADHPLHSGRTAAFASFAGSFGGFLNGPPGSP